MTNPIIQIFSSIHSVHKFSYQTTALPCLLLVSYFVIGLYSINYWSCSTSYEPPATNLSRPIYVVLLICLLGRAIEGRPSVCAFGSYTAIADNHLLLLITNPRWVIGTCHNSRIMQMIYVARSRWRNLYCIINNINNIWK